MLKAVIFDFDGVIADSELLHYRAMNEAMRRRGADIPKALHWEKYLGFTDYENARVVNKDFQMEWGEDILLEIVEEKTAIFDRLVKEETTIIDGVEEFVRRVMDGGIPMAVCSGATQKDIRQMLNGSTLDGKFQFMVTADDVKQGKPDPEGYLLALARLNNGTLGAIMPAQCVVVEDSRWGLEAAAAAGMHRVGVTNTYPAEHLRQYAEMVVERLDAIQISDLQVLCR